jgi:hypothetical protein
MELKFDNNGYTLAVEWLKLNMKPDYVEYLIRNNDGFTLVDLVNQKIKSKKG